MKGISALPYWKKWYMDVCKKNAAKKNNPVMQMLQNIYNQKKLER